MLHYKDAAGNIQELNPASHEDVIKIIKENLIPRLIFDEKNIDDADILLDKVRNIYGRTSMTAADVCNELERLNVFDCNWES